jgi:hypothetical protein
VTCRYLYVEWEDPVFGPRAAAVHTRLQQSLSSDPDDPSPALTAISAQMGLVAQLRHIQNELKVRHMSPLGVPCFALGQCLSTMLELSSCVK